VRLIIAVAAIGVLGLGAYGTWYLFLRAATPAAVSASSAAVESAVATASASASASASSSAGDTTSSSGFRTGEVDTSAAKRSRAI
jgi:hypothetical protein